VNDLNVQGDSTQQKISTTGLTTNGVLTGTTLSMSGVVTSVGLYTTAVITTPGVQSSAVVTSTGLWSTGVISTVGVFTSAVITAPDLRLSGTLSIGGAAYVQDLSVATGLTVNAGIIGTRVTVSSLLQSNGIVTTGSVTGTALKLSGALNVTGQTNLGYVELDQLLVTGTITATTVRSQYIYGDEIRVQGSGSWIKLTYNNDEFRRRRLKEAKDKGSELSEDELSRMMERSVNLHVVADAIEKLEKLGILDIDKAEEEKDAIVEKIKSNGKKGNTSWSVFSSSDRRLKEDVKPLSEQSKSLFDLQGVSFRFKAKEASSHTKSDVATHFGFIAQEVRKVLPDIVHEDIDGWLGLEYQSLIALLVEALKRQQIEIRELRNEQARQEVEIKQLKVTVNSLPRRLSALEEATVAR
jgi:hypothetical protein